MSESASVRLAHRRIPGGGVEFGFWLPGTTYEFSGGFGPAGSTAPKRITKHRYNPVKDGFIQNYQVGFRLSSGDSFNSMVKDAWRWAWETMKPEVTPIDIEVARRAMIDHLADHVLVVGDMAGVGFLYDAVTGVPGSYRRTPLLRPAGLPANEGIPGQQPRPGQPTQPRPVVGGTGRSIPTPEELKSMQKLALKLGVEFDPKANELARWTKILMGFVSKGIESADQLLLEGDHDPGPRGQKMRELGLKIINSFVRIVPMAPPAGTGFNLLTGKPDCQSEGIKKK